jgi:hypothetical protein
LAWINFVKINLNIAFALILAFMSAGSAFAQPYGNEWIVSTQSYYKIPVGRTGIYGLSMSGLQNAGVPVGSVNPQKMQIWRRGVEQAILIKGESDGSFDAADSLFFFGERNDGEYDTQLYLPGAQPHKYYNLYSDTSAYFLTWITGTGTAKRMSQLNSASTAKPAAPYHIQEDLRLFTDSYDRGRDYSLETYVTQFDQGEGWFGNPLPASYTDSISISNVYAAGPSPALEIMFAGRNNNPQEVEITIGSFIDTIQFFGHSVYKFNTNVSFANLGTTALSMTFRPLPGLVSSGLVSLAYIKLSYPQALDMQGSSEKFLALPANTDTTFLSINNPAVSPYIFDITSKNDIRLIGYTMAAGKLNVIVPNMSVARNLFISSNILPAPGIEKVDLSGFRIAGKYIIVYHSVLDSSATEYAEYRASPAGGSQDTLMAEIHKLYNMFSYGEKNPYAIRHFADYMLDSGAPEYLLLLGKGMNVNISRPGPPPTYSPIFYRTDPLLFKSAPDPYYNHLLDDLIPSAGYPGSDLLFTMGLNLTEGLYIPAIPTGRVAARNNTEVRNYLNKIKEHENLDSNMLWRKHLIHLSGGADAGQISDFKTWMNSPMKPIAEGPKFGGKVIKTFSKESPNSIDDSFRLSVSGEVNKGVSFITFLGHSSPSITDIDIGFVSRPIYQYENKGKYPMLLMNGCSSANLFNYYSFSEDWVVTADKGAIAVIGHTDIGYPHQLKFYSEGFYRTAFQNSLFMNKSVGLIQKEAIKLFAASPSFNPASDRINEATIQQMILHGDPFVKIYPTTKPDYSIEEDPAQKQVFVQSYTTQPVTAVSDSFAIGIIVSNFGQYTLADSFAVTVTRSVNNKPIIVYGPVWYPAVSYKDTIYFKIKSNDVSTYGDNVFDIKVDALDSIVEMKETNNNAQLHFFMPMNGIIALLPYEYSIVNNAYLGTGGTVTLVAQSRDLLMGATDYYFEVDTSYLFNSPRFSSAVVSGNSLAKWTNNIIDTGKDSVVYYWRVRFDQIPSGQDTLWGESSFIYIGGSPEGWSQSEYPQFTKDNLSQITLNVPQNKWSFETTETKINIQSMGSSGNSTMVMLNDNLLVDQGSGGCDQRGIIAISFDKLTALPKQPADDLGRPCGNNSSALRSFIFTDSYIPGSTLDQSALIDYIDAVPDGDYILLLANGPGYFGLWNPALKDKFKTALGSTLIDSMVSNYSYIILAKKGNYPSGGGGPLPAYENYNVTPGAIVSLDTTITGTYNQGTITSTLIGPSSEWGSMFRDIRTPDAADSYLLKVERIALDGNSKDITTIPAFGYKFDLDSFFLTLPDPGFYPYIRLIAEISDTVNLTPPQLDKWQVVYRGVPEGTLNPLASGNINQYQSFTKDEGQNVALSFVFENISHIDFPDSLKVKFTITNENGNTITDYITLVALQQGQTVSFNYTINSMGFSGKNVFQVFVNPRDQPEQYYDNNILQIYFTIQRDLINPILDVAFDGQHIMNGDIVSPSPLISISLNDENKTLIKNGTDGMEIFLQRPGQTTPDQILMTSSEIVSTGHVAGTNNTFRIEYHPMNLPDGIYTLIVQGTDSTGNKSASQRYEIKFEVINEVSISYFYPYPNPFSSSTRFVFTLTGNEIPEDLKIQIMTITGKVIREITKSEIGPIHIGNNKTDYAWDGTDEFGDRLANGVYLYRVILKGADDFKHRETAGDHSFKKTWGKLYILR